MQAPSIGWATYLEVHVQIKPKCAFYLIHSTNCISYSGWFIDMKPAQEFLHGSGREHLPADSSFLHNGSQWQATSQCRNTLA